MGTMDTMYFCFSKSGSTDENNDCSSNSPIELKVDFDLNDCVQIDAQK